MPTTPYGGTIPPSTDVGPAPVPTTAAPAPTPVDTGLAFTGYDVLGTLALALGLMAAGWAALRASRLRAHPADDLVVPGAGGDR